MAWSYSASLNTPISRVRQLIGDTVDLGHLIEDETVTYYLTQAWALNERYVAAQCAQDIAARFARQADEVTVDHQQSQFRERSKRFLELAKTLRDQAAGQDQPPMSTGFSGIINTWEFQCGDPGPCEWP